jgi:hypothetical protein
LRATGALNFPGNTTGLAGKKRWLLQPPDFFWRERHMDPLMALLKEEIWRYWKQELVS